MGRLAIFVVALIIGAFIGIVATENKKVPYRIRHFVKQNLVEKKFDPGSRFRYQINVDPSAQGTAAQGEVEESITYRSRHLETDITVMANVFHPYEAEWTTLPLLSNHPELVEGKTVLEIGTGSGIISLMAAKLGASKVVATDINPAAIESITRNAKAMGLDHIVEARLVSHDDMSAYAVIADDEQFDLVMSNPPFAFDIDVEINDSVTDQGQLSFSIVQGLEQHLAPGGLSLLYYDDLFSHEVMVKLAEHEGFKVRSHRPNGLFPWSAETLFNSYLERLLISESMAPDAFRFDYHKDRGIQVDFVRNAGLKIRTLNYTALIPPDNPRYYAGSLTIERNN
jgi:16S rRNA G1207 methylase RsmC